MSLIGKKVDNFTVQGYQNETFREVNFEKDILGKWSIFMFYPADFTFVCPTELEDLEDHHKELNDLGFEVYSVSTDTHFTHKAWHDHSEAISKVTFTMLGDPKKELVKIFDFL